MTAQAQLQTRMAAFMALWRGDLDVHIRVISSRAWRVTRWSTHAKTP